MPKRKNSRVRTFFKEWGNLLTFFAIYIPSVTIALMLIILLLGNDCIGDKIHQVKETYTHCLEQERLIPSYCEAIALNSSD